MTELRTVEFVPDAARGNASVGVGLDKYGRVVLFIPEVDNAAPIVDTDQQDYAAEGINSVVIDVPKLLATVLSVNREAEFTAWTRRSH